MRLTLRPTELHEASNDRLISLGNAACPPCLWPSHCCNTLREGQKLIKRKLSLPQNDDFAVSRNIFSKLWKKFGFTRWHLGSRAAVTYGKLAITHHTKPNTLYLTSCLWWCQADGVDPRHRKAVQPGAECHHWAWSTPQRPRPSSYCHTCWWRHSTTLSAAALETFLEIICWYVMAQEG